MKQILWIALKANYKTSPILKVYINFFTNN